MLLCLIDTLDSSNESRWQALIQLIRFFDKLLAAYTAWGHMYELSCVRRRRSELHRKGPWTNSTYYYYLKLIEKRQDTFNIVVLSSQCANMIFIRHYSQQNTTQIKEKRRRDRQTDIYSSRTH